MNVYHLSGSVDEKCGFFFFFSFFSFLSDKHGPRKTSVKSSRMKKSSEAAVSRGRGSGVFLCGEHGTVSAGCGCKKKIIINERMS